MAEATDKTVPVPSESDRHRQYERLASVTVCSGKGEVKGNVSRTATEPRAVRPCECVCGQCIAKK